jgi:hypothetical protein
MIWQVKHDLREMAGYQPNPRTECSSLLGRRKGSATKMWQTREGALTDACIYTRWTIALVVRHVVLKYLVIE